MISEETLAGKFANELHEGKHIINGELYLVNPNIIHNLKVGKRHSIMFTDGSVLIVDKELKQNYGLRGQLILQHLIRQNFKGVEDDR